MQKSFVTVDVFTKVPFGGNPLAVFLDAEGLDDRQMQNIAMEFNLSETTFVVPPKDSGHTAEVRIFTPRAEIPFAGHPNVGTAWALAKSLRDRGEAVPDEFIFEERAGLVRMELQRDANGAVTGARLAAPQAFSRGDDIDPTLIADACSLDVEDIEVTRHAPCIVSCGTPLVTAALKSREALAQATPRTDVFARELPTDLAAGVYLYANEDDGTADVQVRMFAPLLGVPEDPATGGAGVPWIGLMASLAPQRDITLRQVISQGVDMGRPSLLTAEAEKQDDRVVGTWIAGSVVPMTEGTIRIC